MSRIDPGPIGDVTVVYDGECPVCRSYMLYYRLRSLNARVRLIDARTSDPEVDDIRRHGFDLDQGMVVKCQGRIYHGADAMHILAILGAEDTFFNRVNKFVFRHRRLAKNLYPVLVRGRHLLLRLLGRRLIAES
jgi:predicted DCC family thiol-disulfide oxidoreductase YuxK